MRCSYVGNNHFFIEHDDNKYCFSYGKNVASIIDGCYIEYSGDKYNSATSNKHKAAFRRFYNIDK